MVGGVFWKTILKMIEFVNGKDDIPYMNWKIKHVWNHQPDKLTGAKGREWMGAGVAGIISNS